ncbi:MAG: hypothetical protein JWN34_3708 [Bryobacterales bacterium]|nr:hypothetical protein [Bryobacterales bacterium]
MKQPNVVQSIEKKAPSLRLLLSRKSANKLMPELREDMVDALIECPDPEHLTRRFGSTAIQVVFSILWVLANDVRRLKVRCAATRDGFGRPQLPELEVERRSPGRASSPDLRVVRDVA